jgi:hypothetical protein
VQITGASLNMAPANGPLNGQDTEPSHMSIGPRRSSAATPPGDSRVDQAGGTQSLHQSSQVRPPAGEVRENDGDSDNQAQPSARARAGGLTSATSTSGPSAARLHKILKRLTSGYYDTAPVQNRVAERVKDDLTGPESAG